MFSIFGQKPYSFNLNIENGLPTNEVYQIVQDDFGNMWIGCDAGLFKYDGYEYVQYKNPLQNGRSISGLIKDKKGFIWCRNFNGQVYKVVNDSLKIILETTENTASNIFTVDENLFGWFIQKNKLLKLSSTGKVIEKFNIPFIKSNVSIIIDIVSHQNKLYISQGEVGVYSFDKRTKKFALLKYSHKGDLAKKKNTFLIKNKELFCISENNLDQKYMFGKITKNKIVFQKNLSIPWLTTVIYKTLAINNQAWFCTSNGLQIFSMGKNIKVNDLFSNYKVSYCFKDREGMYWFSTLNDGIFVIPDLEMKIRSEKYVTNVIGYEDKLIFGKTDGSIYLAKNSSQQIKFSNEFKYITPKKIVKNKTSIYIAHGPLSEIKEGKVMTYPFYNFRDFAIVRDTVYFVTSEIFGKVSLSDVRKKDQTKVEIIKKSGGRSIIYYEKKNQFCLISNEGLFRYDNYGLVPILKNGKNIFASSITVFKDKVCIASISSGLLYFNGEKVLSHNFRNEFESEEFNILYGTSNYLWVCGNQNLYRIDKKNKIQIIGKSNGIISPEIKSISSFKEKLLLATNQGIFSFNQHKNWNSNVIPNISIRTIKTGNKLINQEKVIQLESDYEPITIELASVSLKGKSKFNYYYRIKNIEKEWVTIPVQNKTIKFASLPYGENIIQIHSKNSFGKKSRIITLFIHINFPFYMQWWFISLMSILIILIGVFISYLIIKNIKKKSEIKTKLISSQLTALKAQMNPHFMYNALNSIQDLVLERDIKNSNLYLSKFSKLMRKILDASGKEKISLNDEEEILTLYLELEKLRFGDEFNYEIKIDSNCDPYDVFIPSLIIQPFVENSIKHGLLHKKGTKKVSITFVVEDAITCYVEDNGVGRKYANEIKLRRATKHQSFATIATEKRIELLNESDEKNYSFEISDLYENNEPSGTLVTIKMPL